MKRDELERKKSYEIIKYSDARDWVEMNKQKMPSNEIILKHPRGTHEQGFDNWFVDNLFRQLFNRFLLSHKYYIPNFKITDNVICYLYLISWYNILMSSLWTWKVHSTVTNHNKSECQ